MLFLDANAVIDIVGDKRPKVRTRFTEARTAGRDVSISSLVLFELLKGVRLSARPAENGRALAALIATGLAIVDFDAEDAEEAAEIGVFLRRAGSMIGPYDLLIAAQARRRGAALVTHNLREFQRVPGLAAVDWVV